MVFQQSNQIYSHFYSFKSLADSSIKTLLHFTQASAIDWDPIVCHSPLGRKMLKIQIYLYVFFSCLGRSSNCFTYSVVAVIAPNHFHDFRWVYCIRDYCCLQGLREVYLRIWILELQFCFVWYFKMYDMHFSFSFVFAWLDS